MSETRYVAITKNGNNYDVDTNATPLGGIDGLYVGMFETSAAYHILFVFDETKTLTGREKLEGGDWEELSFDISNTPSPIKMYSISLGSDMVYEVTFEGITYNVNELIGTGNIPEFYTQLVNVESL